MSVSIRQLALVCRRSANAGALVALLGGCHAGPDFVPPASPAVTGYTATTAAPDLTPESGEPSQHLVIGQAIPAAWWQLFRSPPLDTVVRQAVAGSPTIEAARARLSAARQAVSVARGAFYPQIDAAALAEREKGPPFASGLLRPRPVPTYNLFSAGPTASFVPDVFGLTARRVEQQAALSEKQADLLAAAQLAVTGNAVTAALTIASVRLQMDAIEDIVADDEKNLALVRQEYAAGKVNRTDVLLAEAQLAHDLTPLPPLKQQRAAAEDALAILVGKSPAEWTPPAFALDEFTLPADLPLSLPSTLVHQRPDILAAEAEVHASSAAIGVAVGQLYPTITLSGALDPTALTPGALFEGSNLAWNMLSGITVPLFHGGALEGQRQEAADAFQSSLSTYKETVLQGLGQVADTLHALGHDAALIRAERRLLDASGAALALQYEKYAAGKIDLLRLLDAERSYNQARISYARARAQRYLDSAQLLIALGGGGWQQDQPLCRDCGNGLSPAGQNAPSAAGPSSNAPP